MGSALLAKLVAKANSVLPDRPVSRDIRGVRMVLPRRHLLPYFISGDSPYGKNLEDLAVELTRGERSSSILDIGANVGDSTLLMRDRAAATYVCVEPDPRWLDYLHRNVDSCPDVHIEPSILVPPGHADHYSLVHEDVGSSRLEPVGTDQGLPVISTDVLLERHPCLSAVRLIKTDTDGYDVLLVPALARTFRSSLPVIFFEFDPRPTRVVTPEIDPADLWSQLEGLGYTSAAVWTNAGELVGAFPTSRLREESRRLDDDAKTRGYGFWDVAVAHHDDQEGLRALAALVAR